MFVVNRGLRESTTRRGNEDWDHEKKSYVKANKIVTSNGLFRLLDTDSDFQTLNLMATLYYTETVPIAQTQTRIPIQIWTPNHYCTHFWDGYQYPDWNPNAFLEM